ncbi:MAG: dihydroxyacetone kinase subunit DhaL [Alphaproteobacteria bacterium]
MPQDLTALGRALIAACAETIGANADRLTALDQAIGDGDHGANMKRGFAVLRESAEEIAALPPSEALKKAGMTLVLKVGGASGPLYGSLLMAMGKTPGIDDGIDGARAAAMLGDGIAAVKARGKSDVGAKTMLDVLVPVHEALAESVAAGATLATIASRLKAVADLAEDATGPMLATRGRASFLGERSIGHIDPGGESCRLLTHAICDTLVEAATR